jgi:colicin import membrane protein
MTIMADEIPIDAANPEIVADGKPDVRLSRWVIYSLVLHGLLIAGLFFSPWHPSPATRSYPVYSVDLVGGEKLGGGVGNVNMPSPPRSKPVERVVVEPTPTVVKPAVAKKSEKEETATKTPKPTVIEHHAPAPEAVVLKPTKKEPAKKEPAAESKVETIDSSGSLDSVRERIMQSAMERTRQRNDIAQKSSKGESASAGPGDGEGAVTLGKGGRGGGTVRGMDFLIYQNRLLETIKANWAWSGRGNLRVVVHFSIRDNGEIAGLKIVQPSGDPTYDESVLRALKKSSPLSAPPENYRRDFADVELAFRPQDLGT